MTDIVMCDALQQNFERVLELHAAGRTITDICAKNEKIMRRDEFYFVANYNPDNIKKYAFARELWARHHADLIVSIADDDTYDTLDTGTRGRMPNSAAVQRSTLKINARQYAMTHECPLVYSERRAIRRANLKNRGNSADTIDQILNSVFNAEISVADGREVLQAIAAATTITANAEVDALRAEVAKLSKLIDAKNNQQETKNNGD